MANCQLHQHVVSQRPKPCYESKTMFGATIGRTGAFYTFWGFW
jgi:hypothetical protein